MLSKHPIASIALCAIMLLGVFSVAGAQGYNPNLCLPDCMSNKFSKPKFVTVTLPNGCMVKVKYSTRTACGVWHDLGIEYIEPLNSDCDPLTIKQMLDLATKEMLKQNPMDFPEPDSGSCTTSWRVVNGACWKDSISCDGDTIIAACEVTACCLGAYEICKDSVGNVTVTKLGSSQSGECDSSAWWCQPVCGHGGGSLMEDGPDLGDAPFRKSNDQAIIRRKEAVLPVSESAVSTNTGLTRVH